MGLEAIAARGCQVWQLGLLPYERTWQWQQELVAERRENPELEDVLVLLEHPPVYTLGRGATLDFLKFNAIAPQQNSIASNGEARSPITVPVNWWAIQF